jgi:hypothetical protein
MNTRADTAAGSIGVMIASCRIGSIEAFGCR